MAVLPDRHRAQLIPEPPGQLVRLSAVRVRHDYGELIATDAGGDVARPDGSVQDAPELMEDDIAHLVAELVIDRLQVINVHHGDGEILAGPLGLFQFLLKPLVEEAAVLELGQVVAGRDVLELGLAV